ncbi:MAG TPA: GNAT family N-acetyltransferase [Planococcus sp. (in: firmicutes)]|nr:GNAT family N-acetyltransferase [Planococcus sp. (in: firmicutes)]
MAWKVYTDVETFAADVEPLLYKAEDKYSLFLGIMLQIGLGRYEDYFLALDEEGGRIYAACLMTPPHPLHLITFQESLEMENRLSDILMALGVEVEGVIGEKPNAERFAEAWIRKTGVMGSVLMEQGLYRADAVDFNFDRSPGTWRIASRKDAPALEKWLMLFEMETGLALSSEREASWKIESYLDRKEVYVWEVEGRPVACLKKSRPTKHGITISFVFTPERYRNKGYASTLVAEVTDELLLEYDFVVLYTDLKNPTSNKLYERIGYVQIAHQIHLGFEDL